MKWDDTNKIKGKATTNYRLEVIEAKREISLSKYSIINPSESGARETSKHHRL